MDSELKYLNHKKDSLRRLHINTRPLTHKIDSIEKAKTRKLRELNTKVNNLKRKTQTGIASLHLPPQAQNEINALTKNIKGFSMPNNFFNLPSNLSLPGSLPGLNIPGTSIPGSIPGMPNLNTPGLPSTSMPGVPNLNTNIPNVNNLTSEQALQKDAMNLAGSNPDLKVLNQTNGTITQMENQLGKAQDPAAAAKQMELQMAKEAINHFAGQEQQLKSAMNQVSAYKQKYSSLKSLADIPKRIPNPLRGKPWQERLVPGLNYYILLKHVTMVDFNPFLTWRFTPRLSVQAGWTERVSIHKGHFYSNSYDRVYGFRASVSFLWGRGFILRFAPEIMSAYLPDSNNNPDVGSRQTIFGAYFGIRKNFSIYKRFQGFSEVLYNPLRKSGQNFYGDQVVTRLGIEFKLKKRVTKVVEASK